MGQWDSQGHARLRAENSPPHSRERGPQGTGRQLEGGGSGTLRQHFAECVQNKELLTDVPGNKIFIVT